MDKKKIIYIGSLLIITAIISIASFSYAIWSNKSEQRGKLNIVAGSLRYELISDDLTNNSITIPANTNKTIEIEINSLNNIESKYELYYTTNNENINIGYSEETIDQPRGTISSRSSKKVTVIIKNKSDSPATITFGCQGGFSDKELILAQGDALNKQFAVCDLDPGYVWDFDYNGTDGSDGSERILDVPCDGYYKLEVWGAQGGSTGRAGGYGGYSVGVVDLNKSETNKLYIQVGGKGTNSPNRGAYIVNGGYNGGGKGRRSGDNGAITGYNGGGGATHIATVSGLLKDLEQYKGTLDDTETYYKSNEILIVAGGGGGGDYYDITANTANDYSECLDMDGGGFKGVAGHYIHHRWGSNSYLDGATQTTGYAFGQGGYILDATGNDGYSSGGGGGGFYGGNVYHERSSGGSGYIASPRLSSIPGIKKSMYCYRCEESEDDNLFTVRTNGTSSYRDTVNCSSGYNSNPVSKCAKANNGYARITYLGEGNTTTLYSAAVDEVYYYDSNNNKQIIGTTDTTGKLENIFVPNNVTLYSTVAKDPTNLSNPYSKTFNTISNEVYLMPDGNILYWYGYKSDNLESAVAANGWAFGSYTIYEPTYYTNYITCSPAGTNWNRVSSVGTKNAVTASKIQSIINLNNVSNNSLSMRSSKDLGSSSTVNYIQTGIPNTGLQYLVAEEPTSYTGYIIQNFSAASGNVYALWYE